jgi:hypothetical protein
MKRYKYVLYKWTLIATGQCKVGATRHRQRLSFEAMHNARIGGEWHNALTRNASGPIHDAIRANPDKSLWRFEVLETYDAITDEQAFAREGELCELHKASENHGGFSAFSSGVGGRSEAAIKRLSERQKGVARPIVAGSSNGRARKVICSVSGKIWGCAKDCATELGVNAVSLRGHLSGNQPIKKYAHLSYLA